MSDHDRTPAEPDRAEPEPSTFERFRSLTERLLHVPKHEVDEGVERDREKRRTA